MHKNRLEAFSDGVIAIILTIMVLELKVPHGDQVSDLWPMLPIFGCYVLSFIYVAIYWNNHHHLFQAVHHVNGRVLWANMHLLFWLSLLPFVTAWAGENHFAPLPVALYGTVLFMAAIAYYILVQVLLRVEGHGSDLRRAIGTDRKGIVSLFPYLAGIGLSSYSPALSCGLYVLVALIWIVPDRRIERTLRSS
jgi:uncharacterized membrane protein